MLLLHVATGVLHVVLLLLHVAIGVLHVAVWGGTCSSLGVVHVPGVSLPRCCWTMRVVLVRSMGGRL